MSLEPSCKSTARAPDGDFDLRLRRGVSLAYASPITVSGWRNQGACRQLNAGARMQWQRFRWRGAKSMRANLERMRLSATVSYAWRYDSRYTLQRFEPGFELLGNPVRLPLARCFVALDLADEFTVRLESTFDLAALEAVPAYLASMDYKF